MTVTDDRPSTRSSAWGFGLDPEREEWMDRALCAQTDPEAFFPEKGGSTREAKMVCLDCPVRDACLEYAIEHDERFGIWGGHSERERRRLKRGEAVTPSLTNKPNRKANGHGFRCQCWECRHPGGDDQ